MQHVEQGGKQFVSFMPALPMRASVFRFLASAQASFVLPFPPLSFT
jgi:hypothetical protein